MNPTVSDRMIAPAGRQAEPAHGGVQRGEQLVARRDLGAGQRVEQRRFARVGVADQRHHRERHPPACRAVQAAGPPHLLQLLLQLDDAFADQAPVGFDLCLAGAAEEAEAAALAFEVGPRPHQARALILQMRQFDLECAFLGGGALAEDVQDQPGAVDHLAGPGALQVALLHRRQRRIDDRDGDLLFGQGMAERGNLPLAQQRRRAADAQGENGGMHDDKPDRGGKADRLRQACLGGAPVIAATAELRGDVAIAVRMVPLGRTTGAAIPGQHNRRADQANARAASAVGCAFSLRYRQGSSPSLAPRPSACPTWRRRRAGSGRPASRC